MIKNETLIGEKFGKLLVKSLNKKENYIQYFNCLCDCGKSKVVNKYLLLNGHTSSCGCKIYQYKKGNKNYRWSGVGKISAHLYHTIKVNAKNRKKDFKITIDDIWNAYEKQDGKCALTGLELKFETCHKDRNTRTASLDRIDSSKGYLKDNIQWVHKNINDIKWDMPNWLFFEYCYLICCPLKHKKINNECVVRAYNNSWKGEGNIGLTYFNQIKSKAMQRGLNFDINIKNLWDLFLEQKGYCALTGLPIVFGYKQEQTASLDRIDNKKGYYMDNIQWVHKNVNIKFKKYNTEEQIIELSKLIINYNQIRKNILDENQKYRKSR